MQFSTTAVALVYLSNGTGVGGDPWPQVGALLGYWAGDS